MGPRTGKTFPPVKKASKLPASRESLGIYLGTYINPKTDGSKIYLNLRLITFQPPPVPLERFVEVADHFANSKTRMTLNRQPRSWQAAKSECFGWLMYSCKSMYSSTFIPAFKELLKIPDDVAVGIQYRSITDATGKNPPFDKENPPQPPLFILTLMNAMLWSTKHQHPLSGGKTPCKDFRMESNCDCFLALPRLPASP